MDSPAQGAKNIPVAETSFNNGTLILNIKVAGAIYEGQWDKKSHSFKGYWKQAGRKFRLNLKKIDTPDIVKLNRPQEPTKPYAYLSQDVMLHL